jgi:hypothetical protein
MCALCIGIPSHTGRREEKLFSLIKALGKFIE